MQFRTEFPIQPFEHKISYGSKILMTGSCFSEHISGRLSELKFNILSNPFGIIYNPISQAAELIRVVEGKPVEHDELVFVNGTYRHFDFHSKFAHADKQAAIAKMNHAIETAHDFLKRATHLVITFGTSVAYQLKDSGHIVANNHKLPASQFNKIQLSVNEILKAWQPALEGLKQLNGRIKLLFAVSPVRHIKDGIVENQLSKSILIAAVHQLISELSSAYYFPSYEIMMDDLRDYRFYRSDLIHPNEMAIEYIFEKFKLSCIDEQAYQLMEDISSIRQAMMHQPFFPASKEHLDFKDAIFRKVQILQTKYPGIGLQEEYDYFSN